MAYENLKDAIKQVIKQNGNQEITGSTMQSTLLSMVDNIPEVVQELGFDENKVISQKAVSSKLDNLAFENREIKKELPKKANTSDVQVSLEELKKEIGDRTVVEGNVTNLPDEEDITSGINESGTDVLSFKDRVYNPVSFSGKGHKILRKNITPVSLAVTKIIVSSVPTSDGAIVFTINGVEVSVDTVTTTMTSTDLVAQKIAEKLTETMTEYEVSKDASTITLTRKFGGPVTTSVFSASTTGIVCTVTDSTKQELRNILTPVMINHPNTIYEIRYDFDLNGETIEMNEGCTLKFDGGRFKNGTLKGNKTTIYSPICTIFDLQLRLSGTYICDKAYPQWFGDVSANKDCTKNIQNCLDFFNKATITEDMMCKNLTVSNSLLEGIDKGMVYNSKNNRPKLIAFSGCDIINTAVNSNIYGLSFCGKNKRENAIVICNDTRIRNCSFSTLSSGIGAKGNYLHMDIFENCDFNNNDVALSNLVDSRITNCMFNANSTAIILQKGSNANIISNCQIEWNVLGISLYQTSFNSITNNQFDRQAQEAININSCYGIQIVANNFNRNGAENDRWNSKCHLAIISTNDILISGNKFNSGSSLDNAAGKVVPSNAFYLERCQVTLLGNYIKDGFVDSLYANFEGKLISKNNIGVDDDISEEYKDFVDKKIQPMQFVVLRQEGTIVKNGSIDFGFPVKALSNYSHSQLMECILSSRNDTGNPYSIKIPFIITNEGGVRVSFSKKTILFSEEDIFNLSFVSYENNMLTLRINNNSNFNVNFRLSILKY